MPAGTYYLCALALAGAFLVAAAAKLARPDATTSAFRSFRIPRPAAAARVVPGAELVVAVLLVAAPAAGGVAGLVLLVTFSAVLRRSVRAGIKAPCRCFGAIRDEPVSAVDLLRNGMLAVLAVAAIAGGTPRVPSVLAVVLVAGVVAAGFAALRLARGHG